MVMADVPCPLAITAPEGATQVYVVAPVTAPMLYGTLEGVPQILLWPVTAPIAPSPPPPDDGVALIATALMLTEPVVLFFATIVNHSLAPAVRPVAA